MDGRLKHISTILVVVALLGSTHRVEAQSSSLLGTPGRRAPLTLADSVIYVPPPPPAKVLKKNDIVTILVDERSQMLSEGEVDRRKNAQYNAALKDWIVIDNLNLRPSPQSQGDPKISAQLNSRYRAEGGIETTDNLSFRIAARVVDVLPNGNLRLEARRRIRVNREVWEYFLLGEIRPEDVQPSNQILSEDIAELHIDKREMGHVRDSYRRGWFLLLLDRFHAF
jgi:flagellar L-ring protein precursor FlgH